jgi:hypothetical protein
MVDLENDGSLHICVYSCIINKIIVGYEFSISKLDDMGHQSLQSLI